MKRIERREEMRHLLALREREGLTYGEAARRGGVRPGTLAWWSRRLRPSDGRARRARADFVEVEVLEDAPAEDSGLEVRVGVHRVRVARDFDAATLVRLLQALSC